MTDPTPEEEAVRRALREVADRTSAAAHEPPPLIAAVRPLTPRRGRERWILGAAAAAVVVVGGVLAAALATDDGDDTGDEVELADDPSTTGDTSTTSSTSSTTTSATTATTTVATATTAVPVEDPEPGVVIASGDGWSVERSGESCLTIVVGRSATGGCDVDVRSPTPAVLQRSALSDGRQVVVVRVGATELEAYGADGIFLGGTTPIADPFVGGARLYVTDSSAEVVVLRDGDVIHGVIHEGELLLGDMADLYPSYRRATGSLTMGRFVEIGAYRTPDGPCVLATQITPLPNVLVASCLSPPFAVLGSTGDHFLEDPYGLVPIDAGTEWSCVLPSGGSCGTGPITPVPELGVGVLSNLGPISVDDGGSLPDHVTFRVGDVEFDAVVTGG